jgi:hypothetical protein
MKRFLKEDQQIMDFQRQQTGIGKAANLQDPTPVNTADLTKTPHAQPHLPFQIDGIIPKIADFFVKFTDIRKELEAALQNPSIKESEKVGILRSIDSIDKINKRILKIPDYLSVFILD